MPGVLFFYRDKMRKRITAYLDYIDRILSHDLPVTMSFDAAGVHTDKNVKDEVPTRKDYEKLLAYHLHQIAFFQHERLVHLIVTALFAILGFTVLAIILITGPDGSILLYPLFLAIVILLIPYIWHYFLLENGVQKMYAQYDELLKQIRA